GSTSEEIPLPRVLVVDDSRSVRETAMRVLARGGYQVDAAPDGADAWALLLERRYDVVVTDLELPRVDGYELIARVRRHPATGESQLLESAQRVAVGHSGEEVAHGAVEALVLLRALRPPRLAELVGVLVVVRPQLAEDALRFFELVADDRVLVDALVEEVAQ